MPHQLNNSHHTAARFVDPRALDLHPHLGRERDAERAARPRGQEARGWQGGLQHINHLREGEAGHHRKNSLCLSKQQADSAKAYSTSGLLPQGIRA